MYCTLLLIFGLCFGLYVRSSEVDLSILTTTCI